MTLHYPGNRQAISHSQTDEFSSVNLFRPQGIIRKGGKRQTHGQKDRRTGGQGQADGHTKVQGLNTAAGHLTHTPLAVRALHVTLVLLTSLPVWCVTMEHTDQYPDL